MASAVALWARLAAADGGSRRACRGVASRSSSIPWLRQPGIVAGVRTVRQDVVPSAALVLPQERLPTADAHQQERVSKSSPTLL